MVIAPLAFLVSLSAHPPAAIPKPRPIELVGKVKEVSGGAGKSRALLLLEGGAQYQLHGGGGLETSELKRLSGAQIRIYGVTGDARIPRGKHVMVDRYEIVDVGKGVVPRVGKIASITLGGQERLLFVDDAGEANLLPEGWARKMTKHIGAKVWMVGNGSGSKFTPLRFAILARARKENR